MKTPVLVMLIGLLSLPILNRGQETAVLNTAEEHVAFAQSIYWSALTPSEKQTFLFAYISSAYEMRSFANSSIEVSPRKLHNFNQEIDQLFVIWQHLLEMEDNGDSTLAEFIGWVDLYYKIDANKITPFRDAIQYADQKLRSGDKSILELFWGRSTAPASQLPEDVVLEQKAIERKIATAEARKSLDSAAVVAPPLAYKPLSTPSQTALILTDEELNIIALAVETECLNKTNPDVLQDPVFLEALAQKHGFDSMAAFNLKFAYAQADTARWPYLNRQIIEQAFDQNCM